MVAGKILQRLDSMTMSLTEKKNELDAFANKAQEAADTLDVASTKLLSHFEDFASLEQILQETLRSGIEEAAQRIVVQVRQDLEPLHCQIEESMRSAQNAHNHGAFKRWKVIFLAGALGIVTAILTTIISIHLYSINQSETDQKLIKYGHAFMSYYEQLPEKERDVLLKKLQGFLR